MRIILTLLVLLTMLQMPAHASDITEAISTSPSWDTFTNKDGTGLYHEILKEVFGLYGVSARHIYSKSTRSEELVMEGVADMMTCDDKAEPPLVMGRYPMYENSYYVFFKKTRIGPWQGAESLRGREVLGQPGFYAESNFPVPVKLREVATGHQALGMILLDRSDFYVDDKALIEQSIQENGVSFDRNAYGIEVVGRRSYHPLFMDNERGKAIRKMYDDGMLRLHREGKLKPIYEKWGHQYPDFDSY